MATNILSCSVIFSLIIKFNKTNETFISMEDISKILRTNEMVLPHYLIIFRVL